MKHSQANVFTEMKKEDKKFGERANKAHTPKDHNKREKHAVNFRKMNPSDIVAMSEYDDDELDDFE